MMREDQWLTREKDSQNNDSHHTPSYVERTTLQIHC